MRSSKQFCPRHPTTIVNFTKHCTACSFLSVLDDYLLALTMIRTIQIWSLQTLNGLISTAWIACCVTSPLTSNLFRYAILQPNPLFANLNSSDSPSLMTVYIPSPCSSFITPDHVRPSLSPNYAKSCSIMAMLRKCKSMTNILIWLIPNSTIRSYPQSCTSSTPISSTPNSTVVECSPMVSPNSSPS